MGMIQTACLLTIRMNWVWRNNLSISDLKRNPHDGYTPAGCDMFWAILRRQARGIASTVQRYKMK